MSGCAGYNEFVADFSGGQCSAPPPCAASSRPGNWLDHLLPDEAPGPCQQCQHGSMGPGSMSGPGPNGLAYVAPPTPQNIPARLHPVPTHPVFSSQAPAFAATAKHGNDPGTVATEKRIPTGGSSRPADTSPRHDPSPRTARANPAPRFESIPANAPPPEAAPAPPENTEPKSDVQPITAYGERRQQPTLTKPKPAAPLQLNGPANAEPITASPASAILPTNAAATTAPAANSPAKAETGEGWHPVLRGGYTSR